MALQLSGDALGLGKVLQVVEGRTNTSAQNNTSTNADTGLSASITPSSTSSKILVVVTQAEVSKDTGNTGVSLTLLRDSTEIHRFAQNAGYNGGTGRNDIGSISTIHLDSPSTTSSVTYKTQFHSSSNTSACYVQRGSTSYSSIILIEVAA